MTSVFVFLEQEYPALLAYNPLFSLSARQSGFVLLMGGIENRENVCVWQMRYKLFPNRRRQARSRIYSCRLAVLTGDGNNTDDSTQIRAFGGNPHHISSEFRFIFYPPLFILLHIYSLTAKGCVLVEAINISFVSLKFWVIVSVPTLLRTLFCGVSSHTTGRMLNVKTLAVELSH